MNKDFINACKDEISANSHKGDWSEWKPSSKELGIEVAWHYAKFTQALLNGDSDKIREYSCDLGVYCSKAFELYNDFDEYDDKSSGYHGFSDDVY